MRPKPLPYRQVRRKLLAAGFTEHAQRGSHVKFIQTTSQGTRVVIVPHHKEVRPGTLRSILNQAGLTPQQFDEL